MGAIISDLKFRLSFHKFVPINFLDAKNGPVGNVLCFCAFTQKSNNYLCVFFLLKGGPLCTFHLWMNTN